VFSAFYRFAKKTGWQIWVFYSLIPEKMDKLVKYYNKAFLKTSQMRSYFLQAIKYLNQLNEFLQDISCIKIKL